MKAIIYCRVSTKDQADFGYSLDSQERACRDFAKRMGYEILDVFIEEGESAKTTDRTQLKILLNFITKRHKEIDVILVYKLDRLARNMVDYTGLVATFSKLGIDLKSATENVNDSPAGKLTKNMIAAIAQFDNDVRSERTKTGMQQAIKEGRWPWREPFGYSRSKNENGKSIIVPAEQSKFVIKAFELFETGLYKQTDLIPELKKLGFKKVTKSLVSRILTNPLYAGQIKCEWFPELTGAIHEPVITQETFVKVQQILSGKRPAIVPRSRNHPDFPLRRFIRCPKCDQKLTGGWSTGRKDIKYAYYRCRTKNCPLNVTKQELEGKFYAYLLSFQPKPEILDLFEAIVMDTWNNRRSEQIKAEHKLNQELKTLNERKNKIADLAITGTFNGETYKQKFEEVQNEIIVKEIELSDTKINLNEIETCLNYCKYFLSNLAKLWTNADVNQKQRFQSYIFPDKIYYENGTFRTTATALIIKQLQCETPRELHLATPTGFEPVLRA